MLIINERISNFEANIVKIYHDIKELATDDEIDAVITQLFSDLNKLEDQITTLENNLTLIHDVLKTAQG